MIKHSIIFFVFSFTILGCSNKDFYTTLQPDLSSCHDIAVPQREECTERVNGLMTYEEYTKERQKLINR